MIEEIEHPTCGKIKMVGIPVKYSMTKPTIRLPPPLLGQHTNEILSELLQYSVSDIAKLVGAFKKKQIITHTFQCRLLMIILSFIDVCRERKR